MLKKLAEKKVLEKNGIILRLGVFNEDNLSNYFGNIPVTTYEMLIDFLNKNQNKKNSIINLINIKKSNLSFKSLIWKKFYNISFIFPSIKIFQLIFSGVPKILGFKTMAFIGVYLDKAMNNSTAVNKLNQIPEILECHYTTGNWSIFIKIMCKDNEHLMNLLNNKIQNIPGISRTETFISLDQQISRQIAL